MDFIKRLFNIRRKCEHYIALIDLEYGKKRIKETVYPDRKYSFNEIAQNTRSQLLATQNATELTQ